MRSTIKHADSGVPNSRWSRSRHDKVLVACVLAGSITFRSIVDPGTLCI